MPLGEFVGETTLGESTCQCLSYIIPVHTKDANMAKNAKVHYFSMAIAMAINYGYKQTSCEVLKNNDYYLKNLYR